jgi:hypothetical protein
MQSKFWKRALCGAGLAAAMSAPAFAAVLTFEGVAPGSIYFPGEGFSEAGHSLTVQTSASVVDSSAAFGPGTGLDLAGPKGNNTQFFIGLNDAALSLKANDGGSFRLAGFDFGFVSALTALFAPGEVPGLMVAAYVTGSGDQGLKTWSFGGANAQGEFSFQRAGLDDMGVLANGVRQVDFFACTADALGNCVNANVNFSQFALDNIKIPEPGSLALVALGLALAGGLRARRAR